ncbi:MAG: FKBP-type peptidyl-prolyl cis-trans isomerase [Calditrichaeota bacterium]|nr:MAG: FKBP-type peptidyl-prolyl cis-trans isomerase [Calditrichota bacterium]
MKFLIASFFLIFLGFALQSCQSNGPKEVKELETFEEKYSYALGLDVGEQFKNRMPLDVDIDILVQGILDTAYADRTILLDKNETAEVLRQFRTKANEAFKRKQAEQAAGKDSTAALNLKEGREFLAANKNKDGVVTTKTGLQYMVLKEGSGEKPGTSNRVKVHYRGTLLDGKEFDSSYKRGEPIEFPVTGVIAGWTEALQLMNTGSKYKLFIPSELAYGARGTGADIGPNATLIFEVELLEVK